jgi:hypothetical protein
MTRAFWLGLIFLIAVGGLAVARFHAPSPVATVPTAAKIIKETQQFVAPSEGLATVGAGSQQPAQEPPLNKTDKAASVNADPTYIKMTPAVISPPRKPQSITPEPPAKIVARHWRDPLAPKLSGDKAAKSNSTKKNAKPPS